MGLFKSRLFVVSYADEAPSLLSAPKDAEKCDNWQQFRLFPSKSSEMNFGTYDFFAHGASNAGSDGTQTAAQLDDVPLDCRLPYLGSSRRSRSPFSDSDSSQYTSFSDISGSSAVFDTPCTRPSPIGSRGRGGDTAAICRAKSRGIFRSRGVVNIQSFYSNMETSASRGTKRMLIAPVPAGKFAKKQRVEMSISTGLNFAKDSHASSDEKDIKGKEAVEEKHVRVREKRRRRREKNCEKYGDKHRLAFTCAFCKFRTFEDKDIEKHFGSTYHHETLDYIRRQAKFDDRVISFLHDCMVHKFRKTVSALCKLHNLSDQKATLKVMEGVTEDDYMRKMEVVHCMACNIYIPAVFSSVQQHRCSPLHLKTKVVYKEQLKRESVLTAKAIINNDSVKIRYEKYIKGEDPFVMDTKEDTTSDLSEAEGNKMGKL
ncbi:DBIRD complex subunit ZNF326 isoform X2 [Silurus meridionalis]|uniref:DBIRD complex subunit ZNF326 isoform X2 n=1 Tax=Silurus meridionalis TaxID=175797 RepID=UPI001EEAC5FB|nr:DBIRD complex subunit ZNF326 isoform X2 [Silurus meridionalis]XP_046716371.1 DBIRD complex subunit ZNF326 isoform X2 [Silurus meridionalis]